MDLVVNAKELFGKADRLGWEHESVSEKVRKLDEDVTELKHDIQVHDQSSILLRYLLEQKRQEVKSKIEDLVTWGLQTVFEERYKFFFEGSSRGGRVEMVPMLQLDGYTSPIMEFHGGGVVEVTAFLLNLLVILLARPKLRRIMLIDESFSMVSAEFLPRVGILLRELATKVDVQFILITHLESLKEAFEKRYKLSRRGLHTVVEEVSDGK